MNLRLVIRLVIPYIFVLLLAGCGSTPDGGESAAGTSNSSGATYSPATETTITSELVAEATTATNPLEEAARELLDAMTLEEKAAQVLLVSFDNEGAMPGQGIIKLLEDGPVGGVLLLGQNVEDEEQLRGLVSVLQEATAHSAPGIALFVAVDQEGGPVERIKHAVERTPSARALGEESAPEEAGALAARVGGALAALGVSVNLAPVADVVSDPDSFLYRRTYGGDPGEVAGFVQAVVAGYQGAEAAADAAGNADPLGESPATPTTAPTAATDGSPSPANGSSSAGGMPSSDRAQSGIISCTKHFPGHGAAVGDTHDEGAVSAASREAFEQIHFAPFRAAIAAGVDAIMMAHITAPALDAENPASMSKTVIEDILRGELGFTGLVVCDDLEMTAALAGNGENADGTPAGVAPAVAALRAGCDLLITTGIYKNQRVMLDGIAAAVRAGDLEEARLDEAVFRILRLKLERGLMAPAG